VILRRTERTGFHLWRSSTRRGTARSTSNHFCRTLCCKIARLPWKVRKLREGNDTEQQIGELGESGVAMRPRQPLVDRAWFIPDPRPGDLTGVDWCSVKDPSRLPGNCAAPGGAPNVMLILLADVRLRRDFTIGVQCTALAGQAGPVRIALQPNGTRPRWSPTRAALLTAETISGRQRRDCGNLDGHSRFTHYPGPRGDDRRDSSKKRLQHGVVGKKNQHADTITKPARPAPCSGPRDGF